MDFLSNEMDFLFEHAASCSISGSLPAVHYFHLFIALMYLVGLYGYYDVHRKNYIDTPEQYAGFWKFLTFLNLNFQFVFFALSSIFDIITPECSVYSSIMRIRDIAFAGIVFPFGVFVFLMFWAIYIGNRDQIFREEDEKAFPMWLIHISHTVELQVVLLEAFIVNHRYPSKVEGYGLTATVGGAYLLWLLYLGYVRNIWMYIVLKDLNWLERATFFVVSFILAFIIYVVGEQINYLFWGALPLPNLY